MDTVPETNFPRTSSTDNSGYDGKIKFLTEGSIQMHLAEKNLNVAKLKDVIIQDKKISAIYLKLKSVLSKHKQNNSFAVAVSGGPDSMALLMLVREWIRSKSGKITVFHFDHKMREDSSKEAKWLQNYISKLGIKFYLLSWDRDEKLVPNMKNPAGTVV